MKIFDAGIEFSQFSISWLQSVLDMIVSFCVIG